MSEEIKNTTEEASFDPSVNAEFVREKIKQKPINKKKLLRRTLFTALMAVIFGGVACVTFFLLEPFFAKGLNSKQGTEEQEIVTVSFPETDESDEILPEDMYANDTEMIEEILQSNIPDVSSDLHSIEEKISSIEFGLNDYQELYSQMKELADVVSRSMVVVTGVHAETDFMNNIYEDNNQVSGVIIADNGPALLVLVRNFGLDQAQDILINFWDGTISKGDILGKDNVTGFMIISVAKRGLSANVLEYAVPATIGSSKSQMLKGAPIIAIGSVSGTVDSVAYGMVTSGVNQLNLMDSEYTMMGTDIVGVENSSGVIINLRGSIIGIIDNTLDESDSTSLISAYGVSELKPLIESLSNSEKRAYFGVSGTEVSAAMTEMYGMPAGIYLRSIEVDSPAMTAGLQNGDIIATIDNQTFASYHDFIRWLSDETSGSLIHCMVFRQSGETYTELEVEVELGEIVYTVEEQE